MKALLCTNWGPPESLVIEDIPVPEPAADQVRIEVAACGINFADTLMIQGQYQEKPPLPFSPGLEVSGVVSAVGNAVAGLAPGDRVVAVGITGGCMEQTLAPAGGVVKLPDELDLVDAAAFPVAYGTSHLGLAHRAGLRAGETLLVHGAAGGVGLAAVEIGKCMGATVIATASTDEKLALAREHGADHAINYRDSDFREAVLSLTDGRGANVIYDPVGGEVFKQSMRCIAWEGRLLVIGFASGEIPQIPAGHVLVKNMSVVGLFWGAYVQRDPAALAASLNTLFQWRLQGRLDPLISRRIGIQDGPQALRALMDRSVIGKIIMTL
ncbi:MAG: NADPH:quinone oxidoreductase family protein [Gammaproteobacteria bacterium]|nr:NADPH:quinone oxidoreductase family protein [Gammaproteobacteria bacterium]